MRLLVLRKKANKTTTPAWITRGTNIRRTDSHGGILAGVREELSLSFGVPIVHIWWDCIKKLQNTTWLTQSYVMGVIIYFTCSIGLYSFHGESGTFSTVQIIIWCIPNWIVSKSAQLSNFDTILKLWHKTLCIFIILCTVTIWKARNTRKLFLGMRY